MDKQLLHKIKEDFKKIAQNPEIHAILVFGSTISGDSTPQSDIDICIVTPTTKDRVEVLRRAWRYVGGKYDIWIFEELPLYIQAEKKKNGKIRLCIVLMFRLCLSIFIHFENESLLCIIANGLQ